MKYLIIAIMLVNSLYATISISPVKIKGKKGLDGEVDLTYMLSSGNTDKQTMGGATKIEYGDGLNWKVLGIASYSYGETSSEKDTNKGLFHIRYIKNLYNTSYDYEIFTQTEYNEFQNMKNRFLAGANIRKEMPLMETMYIGLGAFYSILTPKETNLQDTEKRKNYRHYIH